jgi:hypothetical protein
MASSGCVASRVVGRKEPVPRVQLAHADDGDDSECAVTQLAPRVRKAGGIGSRPEIGLTPGDTIPHDECQEITNQQRTVMR